MLYHNCVHNWAMVKFIWINHVGITCFDENLMQWCQLSMSKYEVVLDLDLQNVQSFISHWAKIAWVFTLRLLSLYHRWVIYHQQLFLLKFIREPLQVQGLHLMHIAIKKIFMSVTMTFNLSSNFCFSLFSTFRQVWLVLWIHGCMKTFSVFFLY